MPRTVGFLEPSAHCLLQRLEFESAKATTEHNDCTVVALMKATGRSYDLCWQTLAQAGRKHRKRFDWYGWVARKGGTALCPLKRLEIHNHPLFVKRRACGGGFFRACELTALYPKGRYICKVKGHVFALIDGKIHDISRTKANRRVVEIYAVLTDL